jgi:DNA polymerase III sliding clamp (beta) subunit (PCNA family)
MTTIKFDVKELSNVITIMNKMQQETGRVTQLAFFKFSNNVAEIFATNWEIKVNAKIKCDMEGDDCNIAIDKKNMLNIINEIKKTNNVTIEIIDGIHMTIKSEDNRIFKLTADIDNEFGIFVPEDILLHQFSTKEFIEALDHVIYAAPKKGNLNSAIDVIHIVDGRIFYCCDNFRLARYELTKPCGISDKTQITTKSAKFLIDAVNVLGEDSGRIGVKDKKMAIEIGNYRIEIMCTDYLLPKYELVLAKEWDNVISIETKKLANALKQIKKAGRTEYVYIETIQDNPNSIRLSSCDTYGNTNMSMEVEAKIQDIRNSKKAFNTQFLIDALKPVRDKYVKLYYPSNDENWIDIFADEKYRLMVMEAVLM